jgi:hypothetical protein
VTLPDVASAASGISADVVPATGSDAQQIPTELPSSLPDSFQNLGPDTPTPDWNQIKDPSQK